MNLPKREKIDLEGKTYEEKIAYLEKVKNKKEIIINPSILDVQEESKLETSQSPNADSGEKKIIIQESNNSSSDDTTSTGVKKITL